MKTKTNWIGLTVICLMTFTAVMSAEAQYRGPNPGDYKYDSGRYGYHGKGASGGVSAPKVESAPGASAPAGFGGNGTVPNGGVSTNTPATRTPNSVVGEITGGVGGLPEDLGKLPTAPGAGVPSAGSPGISHSPNAMNPYQPANKNPQTQYLNPYPKQGERINSVPVQYGAGTPANVQKPFADYKTPANFSPWMNLYRTGNRTGIDNYNFYVKPALEAQQDKEAMQREMRAVQEQQNADTMRQQNQGRYGATYGNVNSGLGASYGFGGGATSPATYGISGGGSTTLTPPAAQELPNKDANTNTPRNINPYSSLLDNSYDFDINPYGPSF